jgi:dTDP-D-glucose 4,6-dehydratase
MPNALVTGGCGFIASNFINIMHKRYPDITFVNIDKLDYCSNVHNVADDPRFYSTVPCAIQSL